MTEPMKTETEETEESGPNAFDLGLHIHRLLMDEPFFASISRRIDKTESFAIPTAGVRINKDTAQFEMLYNPEFFAQLSDDHKLGILKHEFYHLIFEHVTSRKPADGLKRIDNIAMDLSINCHISKLLPSESNPGPEVNGEPMQACIPGEGMFKDLPPYKTYEWYLEALKKMRDEQEQDEGEGGKGQPGEPGDGAPFGGMDSLDDHEGFGEADGTTQEIASERMKDAIKKAAEEAEEIKHQANLERIAKKMARIESGLPVEDPVEDKPVKKVKKAKKPTAKKAPVKKTVAKKPAAKRGRPKKTN